MALTCSNQLNKEEKDHLVKQVLDRVGDESEVMVKSPGYCIQFAHHTMLVLVEAGLRPVIQAGTMCWPRVLPEQDDGESSTHFSYMWDPESKNSRFAMTYGALPEIHVWVGLPDTQELIDLSVKHLPQACQIVLNEPWLGPRPPDYLWQRGCPNRVVYDPNPDATGYAMAALWHRYKPDYLQPLADALDTLKRKWGI